MNEPEQRYTLGEILGLELEDVGGMIADMLAETAKSAVATDYIDELVTYFAHAHLPDHLQIVSAPFGELALTIKSRHANGELKGTETVSGLRKLLEAKDCIVRAAVPTPGEPDGRTPQ